MVKWLRKSKSAMVILTIIRIWLGYLWVMDGFEKVSAGFSAKGFVGMAIKSPVLTPEKTQAFGWYTSFLKEFVMPHISLFSTMVAWGELFVGLGLIFGTLTTAAAFFGMMMNFCYLMAGTVSVNPMYIFWKIFILVAGFNAGKIGLDRWIIPFLREKVPFLKKSVE